MPTIRPIEIEEASAATRRLLNNVNAEAGEVSNMVKTMAHSTQTLEAYLLFSRTLNGGKLSPKLRELIALTVGRTNRCDYSLAQHASLALERGLTNDEILAGREARAADKRTAAALKFARDLVIRNADASTGELRNAGYDDAEIVDIVAQVALNVFENYFNTVVQTEIDFPMVGLAASAA